MLGINSSRLALAMSAAALFVSLGGTALAVSQIGTNQIKNSAITSSKIKNGAVNGRKLANAAVANSKLANGAVSASKLAGDAVDSSKVRDGSLHASDVAPNTFLAANGTAADSQKLSGLPASRFLAANGTAADSQNLGGLPASQYTQGRGSQVFRRIVVAPGGSLSFLSLGFATLTGNCSGGNVPTISFTPAVSNTNYFATVITSSNTVAVDTLNAIPAGAAVAEPNASGNPQMITYRDSYNDGVLDHVATAVATGQFLFGTGCVFTGQGLTTG
jgi:hypothetical protein